MTNPQIEAAEGLPGTLSARRWNGGIRLIIQGSMRAVTKPGQVDLEAGWRADVFTEAKQRKPAFVLVADTPAQLFTDLAALAGEEP